MKNPELLFRKYWICIPSSVYARDVRRKIIFTRTLRWRVLVNIILPLPCYLQVLQHLHVLNYYRRYGTAHSILAIYHPVFWPCSFVQYIEIVKLSITAKYQWYCQKQHPWSMQLQFMWNECDHFHTHSIKSTVIPTPPTLILPFSIPNPYHHAVSLSMFHTNPLFLFAICSSSIHFRKSKDSKSSTKGNASYQLIHEGLHQHEPKARDI